MKTKNNCFKLKHLFIGLLIISLGTLFSGCSHSFISQVTAVDSSLYHLPVETQIQIFPATISGKKFYKYWQHNDYLYFTFFKHSDKYKIKVYGISSSIILPLKISKQPSIQTVPSSVDSPFTMRGEKISVIELNNFFDSLYSVDHFDFKNHPENYIIKLVPDPYIQTDSLGRYFNMMLTASPKDSSAFTSGTTANPHPCPKCSTDK